MAYDMDLAARIRALISKNKNLEEKKMFGGVGFLINGNLACGVNKNDMILRVAPDQYDALSRSAYTRVFDLSGKPMKGWLVVEPAGMKSEAQLKAWVSKGIVFAKTLPAKKK
jgi:TfoX/Sxy family transcriptional regulator of competence genes